jgi:D-3-phosphoglycerate dehydrogenase
MTNFCEVNTFDILKNTYEELPSLIASADCISLHLPLNNDTNKFIDSEKISWMKKDCVLVNTARGQIICENSLFDALKNERIFAILDVFWQEPYKGKLLGVSPHRLMVTPHIASTCEQFLQGCANDLMALSNSI